MSYQRAPEHSCACGKTVRNARGMAPHARSCRVWHVERVRSLREALADGRLDHLPHTKRQRAAEADELEALLKRWPEGNKRPVDEPLEVAS